MTQAPLTPERFEAWLDKQLDSQAAEQVRQQVASDPRLTEIARLQASIDQSIAASYQTPGAERVLAAVTAAAVRPAACKPARPSLPPQTARWAAIAACIAIFTGTAYWLYFTGVIGPSARDQIVVHRTRTGAKYDGPDVVEAYKKLVADGFKPTLATQDPRAIASSVWRRTGQGLVPTRLLPDSSRILGVSEVACLSPRTLSVMMDVNGKPLALFIDRLENDRQLCVDRPLEITPFRHVIGSLVIYEVTPHGRPIVRDCFADPQQSREWYESGGGL